MLAPLKKRYDQPRQHIKEQRLDFSNKGPSSQRYVFFPVAMYGCESWTIKKAERQRIDGFELWYWRRLLRVPWTASGCKQSIVKEISPEFSLEALILKLKLQCFGHLMWRTDSFEKTLMLGKIEGGRRREQKRMRWLDGITDSWTWVWVSSYSWWWTEKPGICSPWGHKDSDTTERLNWTEWLILLSTFSYAYWPSTYFLWRNVCSRPLPF